MNTPAIDRHYDHPAPKPISPELYDQLVYYFQYASSAYTPFCASPNGNHLVSHFVTPSTGAEGFVARDGHKKELVVALRGTFSVADILLDSQIELVPFISPGVEAPSETRVHAGFLVAWNTLALQVLAIVGEQLEMYPGYSIATTGHSLGGALSILAAVALKQNFPNCKVTTYSFGAPRTGNEAFAALVQELFDNEAYRVVHSSDGVPTMVPIELGYYHHGIEYWQKDNPPSAETTVQCSRDGEDPQCSASIPSGGLNQAHMTYFNILASTPFCM